jgi:DNA-binding CsgD family transcriptional regulator
MYVPRIKIQQLHTLIETIHGSSLQDDEIQSIAQQTSSILDADYFALLRFSESKDSVPSMISNNPPEFYPAYNEVFKEDFLVDALITSGKTCVLQRIPGWNDRQNRNFLSTLASVRPASDGIYIPIKAVDGTIRGLWAIARAGLDSPAFSDNDIDLFSFISSFLAEAYARLSISSSKEENTAYLDLYGNILLAGKKIQARFGEVFGIGRSDAGITQKRNFTSFLLRYRTFATNHFMPGLDRWAVNTNGRLYTFYFTFITHDSATPPKQGVPYALVSYADTTVSGEETYQKEQLLTNKASCSFTKREREVLRCIFKGMSNKEIAYQMRVDESTVKRHTHNIYEKTGFYTRVNLVLNLSLDTIPLATDSPELAEKAIS